MNPKTKFTSSGKYHCLEYLKRNSVELYLNYCGKQACPADHSYGPAARNEYLLHYVLSGSGSFYYEDREIKINKHDAFLILPEEITTYTADSNEPWTYLWIGFNGTKALDCLHYAGFSQKERVMRFKEEDFILTCVDNMLDAHQMTYANDLIRQSNLLSLLAFMIRENQKNQESEKEKDYPQQVYIEYAMDYITHNIGKSLKVSDIASYIGIDRSYLTKNFKKILGISPQQHILNVRMSRAAALLQHGNQPINHISNMVGYGNPLAFSKVFKQHFGISPKAYREEKQA